MGKEKKGNTHGQSIGIAWLSIGFILIITCIFFCSRQQQAPFISDSIAQQNIEELQKKEDSSYRAKRTYRQPHRQQVHPSTPVNNIPTEPTPPPVRRQALHIELNSADTTTLMLLHGIGPTYARRIVNYRQRLGGFISLDQLLEVYGFTPDLLNHIAPYISIDTTQIVKLPINTIDLKHLIRHPYIEYFQARDIINLRQLGTHFENIDDLRAVPSMADSTLSRLTPYIDFL